MSSLAGFDIDSVDVKVGTGRWAVLSTRHLAATLLQYWLLYLFTTCAGVNLPPVHYLASQE
jgi:hypothetical protein